MGRSEICDNKNYDIIFLMNPERSSPSGLNPVQDREGSQRASVLYGINERDNEQIIKLVLHA